MILLNRRQLVRYSAASLLAAPFCRLLGRPAQAGVPTGAARRLLVVFSPNGTIHSQWRPSGGKTDFTLAGSEVLSPLEAHRDELLIMDGIDFEGVTNHEGGMGAMLTAGGGTSIDQHIADAIGGSSRFSSLELGALTSLWGGSTQTRMSYRDGSYVTPDDNPLNVWTRLFGDLGDANLLARRQSVLDIANAELADLRSRLGVEEQHRLDEHLDSLRAVERSLSDSGSCESPPSPGTISSSANDSFPDIVSAQLKLAVQALACGATNVASVQLSHTVSPTVFTWLGETDGHHSLSHCGDTDLSGMASFAACERWFSAQFAALLDDLALRSDPETGGSLLDSTVVLWVKEMGDSRAHVCTDVPWIIAGGGGFFRTGRYLSLGGTHHDGILTSVCNAFGLTNTTFGAGTTGPLDVLR